MPPSLQRAQHNDSPQAAYLPIAQGFWPGI